MYTFMAFLGDVGGFNSLIIAFPTFFLAMYAKSMHYTELFEKAPLKKVSKKEQ